jgi:hypothetical protein
LEIREILPSLCNATGVIRFSSLLSEIRLSHGLLTHHITKILLTRIDNGLLSTSFNT